MISNCSKNLFTHKDVGTNKGFNKSLRFWFTGLGTGWIHWSVQGSVSVWIRDNPDVKRGTLTEFSPAQSSTRLLSTHNCLHPSRTTKRNADLICTKLRETEEKMETEARLSWARQERLGACGCQGRLPCTNSEFWHVLYPGEKFRVAEVYSRHAAA